MVFSYIQKNYKKHEYNRPRKRQKKGYACYAPFNTIRFTSENTITNCCYNNSVYVNKSETNVSLKDVLSDENFKRLRNNLREYNFDNGCQYCGFFYHNGNYPLMHAYSFDSFQNSKNDLTIRRIEFDLSNRCNLECKMCIGRLSSSIRKNIEKLPAINSSYNKDFLSELKLLYPNLEVASFVGGEPFLISLYYDIWNDIITNKPEAKLIITTNATVLNSKIKDLLERGNFFFSLSIDSFKKEKYEYIRKGASYERTMQNLEYFIDYSKRHSRWLTVNVCLMQENYEEIPEIVELLTHQNIGIHFNMVDFPLSSSLRGLNSDKLNQVYSFLKSHKKKQCKNNTNWNKYECISKHVKALRDNSIKIEKSIVFTTGNSEDIYNSFNKYLVKALEDSYMIEKQSEILKKFSNLFCKKDNGENIRIIRQLHRLPLNIFQMILAEENFTEFEYYIDNYL